MNRFAPEIYDAATPGKAFWLIAPPIGGFLFVALLTLIATTTYDAAMMQAHDATEAVWVHAVSPSPLGNGVL